MGINRVIIVDDEPITRMDLADILQEAGYQLSGSASDGFDAIELCREVHPDVVLMDVKMPVFDGLSAAETILGEDLAGCVVLLTAFSDQEMIRRASEIGVTGYLVKPIQEKSLLTTIEVALAQSNRLRESRIREQDAKRQIQEDRQIHKAQQLLAVKMGIAQDEAYRLMRKTAMDKRISLAALAQQIIRQENAGHETMEAAKKQLMAQRGMSEGHAYRYIMAYSKRCGCSPHRAARLLLDQLSAEV